MDKAHLQAILTTAEAKDASGGWLEIPEGRHVTFYVGHNGSTMSVARATSVRVEKELLYARTAKGETYVVIVADVFAGAIEGTSATNRKAGFTAA